MIKTRNRFLTAFCILLFAFCICAFGAVSARAEAADLTVTIDTGASVTLKDADGDGYYDIGTADELYAFAAAVNDGNTTLNGELTANIVVNMGEVDAGSPDSRAWDPINDYAGTFDGNGKTISGLFMGIGYTYRALFRYVTETGCVKNVGVVNSFIWGNYWCGGIVGTNYGTVENCFYIGSVYAERYGGGLFGYNEGLVKNCYTISSVTGQVLGGLAGQNDYGGTFQNCYYNSDVFSGKAIGVNSANVDDLTGGRPTSDFKNGTVCALVGYHGLDSNCACFACGTVVHTLDEDGNCVNNCCDHSDSQHSAIIDNKDGTHGFTCTSCEDEAFELHKLTLESNGFCTVCGGYQLGEFNDEISLYEISNAGQLFWFANYINTVDRTASAVLTADIDLENRPWTPIGATGEENNNFRGVFDGQNHTIKGLYVEGGRAGLGFFGEVRTGTVKNFTIYGEVIVNTEVDYVGGVIGSICGVNGETVFGERNGAIIQNITSYVNLTAKAHGVGMIGGFVGYANHQSLIENCSWYGTFDAGIYRVDSGAGGFIGKIQENTSEVTIRDCGAYGTIKTNYVKNSYNNYPTIYMGGFLSFSNTNAQTTLENCLFAGKFERGANLTDEARLGAFGTLRSVNAIKNCYYLGDGVLEAVHSDSPLKPGSNNVEITSVTGAQLLSGEVAYKLQGAYNDRVWGQTLTGDNRQSYPVLGGEPVTDEQRFEIYRTELNLGTDLSMNYYVMGYAPEFNEGGLYMELIRNGVRSIRFAGEPNADGFYVFTLEGITPQCLGDSIRAILYYNNAEVASHGCEDGKEYSVEKNLLNLLEKYKDDAALVALINDTLAYGKAAEEYRGHTSIEGNYTGTDREIPESEAQVADVITGYTVRFGTAISIIIEVDPNAFGNKIYKVECNGTELRNFPSPNSPLYKVTNIAATDFDKEWEFVIRESNPMGDVYGTVVISVNDYLYAISQSSTDEKMVNLAKALYNYGVSAEIYNHVKTGDGEHYYVEGVCACGKPETIDATAMTADELNAAVSERLAAGNTNPVVTLAPDAPAQMVTAIRRTICDTEDFRILASSRLACGIPMTANKKTP